MSCLEKNIEKHILSEDKFVCITEKTFIKCARIKNWFIHTKDEQTIYRYTSIYKRLFG